MTIRQNLGRMPGVCTSGQLVIPFGQIPGEGIGANSSAPMLALLAGLSHHNAIVISGNLGLNAGDQETAEAIQALTVQSTLLCQSALCEIPPTDAWKIVDPIAQTLKAKVLPEIHKIDGFAFPKALAAAFIDMVLACEQEIKGLGDTWKDFKPEACRGEQTDLFNGYAKLVLSEAFYFQNQFNPYGKGIEATVGYMLGAVANLLKIKANYPALEIPGLDKTVAIIEQFKSEDSKQKSKPFANPLVEQAVEFFNGVDSGEIAAATVISGTMVQQLSHQLGDFDTTGPVPQIDVNRVVGASAFNGIPMVFGLITNTFPLTDPLQGTPRSTAKQGNRQQAGVNGTNSREPAMAGAGSTGQH